MKLVSKYPLFGLILGATAWSASTQLGYSVAHLGCPHVSAATPLTFACAGIAAAGLTAALLRWRGNDASELHDDPRGGDARKFLLIVSALASLLFALTIALQSGATFIINGCQT